MPRVLPPPTPPLRLTFSKAILLVRATGIALIAFGTPVVATSLFIIIASDQPSRGSWERGMYGSWGILDIALRALIPLLGLVMVLYPRQALADASHRVTRRFR